MSRGSCSVSILLAVLVSTPLLPACSLYFGEDDPTDRPGDPPVDPPIDPPVDPVPTTHTLTPFKAIAGERPVKGIDSDRAGGLWILYRNETAGYYDLADVFVTHLDANGTKVKEFHFHDEYLDLCGLAFTGNSLWLSYTGAGDNFLREIDATTGKELRRYASMELVADLTMNGDQLVASRVIDQILAFDPKTGGVTWRFPVTLYSFTTLRAVAADGNGLWIAGADSDRVYKLDSFGHTVGSATTELLANEPALYRIQMAFDGESLIVAKENQITWLRLAPVP